MLLVPNPILYNDNKPCPRSPEVSLHCCSCTNASNLALLHRLTGWAAGTSGVASYSDVLIEREPSWLEDAVL